MRLIIVLWGLYQANATPPGPKRRTSELAERARIAQQLAEQRDAELQKLGQMLETPVQGPPAAPQGPAGVPGLEDLPAPLTEAEFGLEVGDPVAPSAPPAPAVLGPVQRTNQGGTLVLEAAKPATRVLPPGSYVLGRVLSGALASPVSDKPIMVQLDRAFLAANGTRIDLSGCHVIASVQADLSAKRADGRMRQIVCGTQGQQMWWSDVDGWLVDARDNAYGIAGKVYRSEAAALGMALVTSVLDGVGSAVAQTQRRIVLNPAGAVTDTNHVGAAIAGETVSSAMGRVADWSLDRADALHPVIAVNSGLDVWMVLLSGVDIEGEWGER